jgi:hypothetical protein
MHGWLAILIVFVLGGFFFAPIWNGLKRAASKA